MRSVLVSHPHAAVVSIAVARAFDRAGALALFATGVAACEASTRGAVLRRLASRWPEATNRLVGIPRDRLRSLAAVEIAARVVAAAGHGSARARRTYDTLFPLHDAAIAAMPWPNGVEVVYAYEDAALRTFRRAAARGLARVLDVPSVHGAAQERIWSREAGRWPGAMEASLRSEPTWKLRRKTAELGLADVLCVASDHSRRTLQEAGIGKPIVVAPYGFPLERFSPRKRRGDAPFTVVSVGAHDLRKGTPYLLEAWTHANLRHARLRLVGPMRLTAGFVARYASRFEHVPHLPRAEIAAVYQDADLLVFPTLADGFGLVIQEAMCSGIPVLTTPCSGGPECLRDGVEGWLVPPADVDALADRLRWAAANRDRVAQMGAAARRRAEQYGEREAGDLLVSGLERALGRP